jgi:hypothetical protein
MISPDPNLGARVFSTSVQGENRKYELHIGYVYGDRMLFSVPIPNPYEFRKVLIGWRPSAYPYPQG